MEKQERHYHDRVRLVILLLFLTAVISAYIGVLYQTQIRDGARYLEQSIHNITKTVSVESSRGNITDRNGRALVSNRSTYSLTFDPTLLGKEDDENEAILRLIRLCQERGVVWEDNLPITQTTPFTYTYDTVDSAQQKRFCKYLKEKELISENLKADDLTQQLLLDVGLTPDALLTRLREKDKLSEDYTEEEARLILGVRYELEIRSLMNINAYVFATDVDTELISILADGGYDGVRVSTSSIREYNTDFAAHILGNIGPIFPEDLESMKEKGYRGDELVGKSGVELAFEQYLRGNDGKRVVSTNADGKVTGEYYKTEPQPGGTVELTIDIDFQQQVEEILAGTVEKMNRDGDQKRGASAVVTKVGTGEILALANYPTYHLATFNADYAQLKDNLANPMLNRATQSGYAPGSTFKPCTAVAALTEGKITTGTTIRATGKWLYPNAPSSYANCWIYPAGRHGVINVTQAITVSCNYFFAEMGYQLGLDKLNEYANAFGLGERTGIEIGDVAGHMAQNPQGENHAPWAGFGQADYLFTPVQLSNYVATLAADGRHYTPHLLKAVRSYDYSQVLATGDTEPKNVIDISAENIAAVKKGMLNLTTTGSLKSYFTRCVVEAGAKTGTAQISSKVKNNGVFICFAPYEDPEIAVAVIIERGGSGSALANTAIDILNAYFSNPAEEQSQNQIQGEYCLLP